MVAESLLREVANGREWEEQTQVALLCRFIDREGLSGELSKFLETVSDASAESSFDILAWTAHENRQWRLESGVPGLATAQKRAAVRAQLYLANFGEPNVALVTHPNGVSEVLTKSDPPICVARFSCVAT